MYIERKDSRLRGDFTRIDHICHVAMFTMIIFLNICVAGRLTNTNTLLDQHIPVYSLYKTGEMLRVMVVRSPFSESCIQGCLITFVACICSI